MCLVKIAESLADTYVWYCWQPIQYANS